MRTILASLATVAAVLFCGCGGRASEQADEAAAGERIVSMAPSLTETLFALELGPWVVADTAFCVTPEAAKALPKVGAWSDANLEQVLAFNPTCVCLPATHPMAGQFRQAGLPVEAVPGRTLDDVLDGIMQLGRRFRREEQARGLVAGIHARMEALSVECAAQKRLDVVVVVGRVKGQGRIRDVIVAGHDGYFRPLLEQLNCRCVPDTPGISYPSMTLEGFLALEPDVILEIAPECAGDGGRQALEDWQRGADVLAAVRAGRVLVFTENYATVPGLRTAVFAESLAERLAPFRQTGAVHE